MIVTVTLNASLDRTIEVDVLTRGAVIRARSARLDPGGKGVNVSRALIASRVAATAVVAVGGADGDQLHRLLTVEAMPVRAVRVAGRTRSNVTIVEPGGVDTKLNEPGGPCPRRNWTRSPPPSRPPWRPRPAGRAGWWAAAASRPASRTTPTPRCAAGSRRTASASRSTPAARRCAPPSPPGPT